ncbi:MAG: phosphotransferase family protein [Gammaproteobacteria bacterium]|nr:phosphotransferase family protein [Gammaproteobacteria bacterium]
MTAWDWDDAARSRLAAFLEKKGITRGQLTTKAIGDGHSNLTFLVTDANGRQVIVRRPPPPPTPPGAHDMLREARLISAVGNTRVPVAECLATAEAGEVIDVHFYVMSFASGPVVTTSTPAPLDTPAVRRQIGLNLIDTLADLHAADWQTLGLADMGKPEGFNARHRISLARLVADEHGQPPPLFATVDRWLADHVPPESGATIIHNDYRIGNVILSARNPGTIEAVLDWELATLGDPLFDLGYFLASIPEPNTPLTPTAALGTAMLEDGYPGKAELAERYAARTGADLSNLNWYQTLALWKLAVLYEYGRRRAAQGIGDPYFEDESQVQSFLAAAHQTAGLPPLAAELIAQQESQ